MAVAFDVATENYNAASSITQSFSHTCTGANLFLIVQVSRYATVSVTYNGVALTYLSAASAFGGGNARLRTWVLASPATGTNTVLITYDAAYTYRHAVAASFTGVLGYGAAGVAPGSSAGGGSGTGRR